MKNYRLTIIGIILFFSSCITTTKVPDGAKYYDYFHYKKTEKVEGNSWVILLPGSSGLKIFDDEQHYFNVAEKLNKEGFSVILVDYKPAYKASGRKVKETTGEKILWVTEMAMKWGVENNFITPNTQGSIVGWSLAGEGLILLANNKEKLKQLNIKSIALYYPSNRDKIKLNSKLPILVQTGKLDNITPLNEINEQYSGNNAVIIDYDNAYHAFDVESLEQGKEMRFPALFGKKYIFKYSQKAKEESIKNLIEFLK